MKKWIAIGIVTAVLVALAFPVSNLFIKPAPVTELSDKAKDDPALAEVAHLFETKCHYCHVPGASLPFYASLPVAKQLMDYDIRIGLTWFEMPEELFPEGGGAVPEPVLAKIEYVVDRGQMPPLRYLAMHWDHSLSAGENKTIKDWLESVRENEHAQADVPEELKRGPLRPVPKAKTLNLDPEKVAMGEKLFHDTRLSTDNTLSCASCHALDKGGTDQKQFATGVNGQVGPINSPTVYNSAFQFAHFWDGRAATLEEQAGGPVENPIEMASTWPEVLDKLNKDPEFVQAFQAIYPGPLNADNIKDAIAEFERSLMTPNSRFDQYLLGNDDALTAEEKQGHKLFTENRCATCHAGEIMGGKSYEKMGRHADYFAMRGGEVTEADHGRFNHSKRDKDKFKFKVPTLRNIAVTHPYFHDGSTSDLAEVVTTMESVQNGKGLTEAEVDKIAAFLRTLTGEYEGKSLE